MALWSLLASHSFYAFGHQPTFNSIPWDAAFLGVPGNFQYQSVQALLVLLSINAGHILAALLLPLICTWPYSPNKLGFLNLKQNTEADLNEMDLQKSHKVMESIWRSSLQYLTLLSIKVSLEETCLFIC